MTRLVTMRLVDGVKERRCSACHNWWPAARSHFTPAKNGSGWHCTCKPCIALWVAERRARLADALSEEGDDFDLPVVHRIVDARLAPPVPVPSRATWLSPVMGAFG